MKKINNNLLLGISTGVAVISFAGFLIMTTAYFEKNQALADAMKEKKDSVRINDTGGNQAFPATADLKVNSNDWIRGDKDAPITIIEFSDFQCPFCAKFHNTLKQIISADENVRWVYRNFPLPSHPFAREAALAAECAGEQGKFWEYADELLSDQASINSAYMVSLAGKLGLDQAGFDSCLSTEKYAKKIDGYQAEAKAAGANATPTSFINGRIVEGAVSFDDIKNIISDLK